MEEETMDVEQERELLASTTLSSRINRRSELAQEFISQKTGFLERWALLIFLVILLLLLAATWFVKYPDVIQANAILTAANAPKEIVPRQEGRLVKLFVHNNEQVSQGQVIGWIESVADHAEVTELSSRIDSSIQWMNEGLVGKASGSFDRHYTHLGEIQQNYQQFIAAWQQFNDYRVNGFYSGRRALLENDVHALDSLRQTIESQKDLTEQDLKLARETFNMNEALMKEKVLSQEEFRGEKSKFVNKEMALPQLQANLLSNEAQKRDKLKEIEQLDHDMSQQEVLFRQALQSLQSVVDDWKQQYMLESPIEGKVSFVVPLQENQFVQAGRLLGYINPSDTHFYAEANLSQSNFGKIDTGLHVQLRFDAYPYQEMGFVEGTLNYISSVPSDSGFLATIRLDHGLMTNNHNPLPYKTGLRAQALIITKNMRLLKRLYYNMAKSISVGNKQ